MINMTEILGENFRQPMKCVLIDKKKETKQIKTKKEKMEDLP